LGDPENLPKYPQKAHNFIKNEIRKFIFGIVLYFATLFGYVVIDFHFWAKFA
jgi:hypothetical protein